MGQRATQWFAPHEAAALVDEGGLAEIIARFGTSYLRVVTFPCQNALVRHTSAVASRVI
ncbi:MAG: hypothetical protein ACJ8AW_12085 [Rhodopila sp.]